MTPEEILAIIATWAPDAIKLLDDGIHLLMSWQQPTEAQAVQAARDAASAGVDAYEAAVDKTPDKP